MATLEFTFSPGTGILVPVYDDPRNTLSPIKLGPSQNLTRGTAIARKTSDTLCYPLNTGASDGTQLFAGFLQYSCSTDASGNHYLNYGTGAGVASWFSPPTGYINAYTGGVFDPNDLQTNATPVAEVDTFTPGGTITTGDVYTLTITYGGGTTAAVSFTVGATATAAAVSAGLIAAWNSTAPNSAYATAAGTNTVILTSAIPGNVMNVAGSVVGVGTVSKAITTVAAGRAIADIQGGAPGARVLYPSGFWSIA